MKKLLACAALIFSTCAAFAQSDWPQRPITLVVPLSPGGSTDSTARLIAQKLKDELGQPIIIENRVGAGGNIGTHFVVNAAPDGYTLLMATSTLAANMTLYKNIPFDIQKDLAPVSQIALIPNVLMVNPELPVKTLGEFITLVRQKEVNYGSAGNGTSQHLSGALFNSMVHGKMVHVPYKGGAPANVDLLAGHIQLVFSPLVEILPFIETGKLRALGVTTKARSPRLPNLPAIDESLPGFDVALWNGILAPAKTPPAVIAKLYAAVHKVMQNPDVLKTFAEQGTNPVGSTPAEFKQLIAAEVPKWARLVKLSGAELN
jgi:tripartite-type tricarboxylate transporter receptor subunit TctC